MYDLFVYFCKKYDHLFTIGCSVCTTYGKYRFIKFCIGNFNSGGEIEGLFFDEIISREILNGAIEYGDVDNLKLLVECAGNNKFLVNSAIMKAIHWNKIEILNFLIDKGLNVNCDHRNHFHYSIVGGKIEILEILLENYKRVSAWKCCLCNRESYVNDFLFLALQGKT